MGRKNIMLVAQDYGESRCMTELAFFLGHVGYYANPIVVNGETNPSILQKKYEELYEASNLEEYDLYLVTMSNKCELEVAAAKHAMDLGKKLILMGGYGAWRNPAFEFARKYIDTLLVIDSGDVEAVNRSGWFKPNCAYIVGDPLWDDFYHISRDFSRDDVRKKLHVALNERLILVAGEKSLAVNFPLAVCIMEAIDSLPDRSEYKVIFSIHPGHELIVGFPNLLDFYRRKLSSYGDQLGFMWRTHHSGFNTSQLVPGTDIVIGTTSTLQIQAAGYKIPSIAVLLRKHLPKDESDTWPPVARGAVVPVYGLSSEKLASLIVSLQTIEGGVRMRQAQSRYFPLAKTEGQAYKNIVKAAQEELLR